MPTARLASRFPAIIVAAVLVAALLLPAAGCTPRVRVTANPGPGTDGIRYYRPKPYLKVVPAEVQVAKDASRIEPGLVQISLVYLPDFTEEYAIDVRPGLGIADVSLTLEDGWNLTEINQELDSQTDENLSAAGDLIKAVSGIVPTAAGDPSQGPQIEFTVPATDVPIGFYESVIGRGPDGRKRLYGFRYLGFLPYQTCPTAMGGSVAACCDDPTASLYGLTFQGGRMVFRPLAAMAMPSEPLHRHSAAEPTVAPPPVQFDAARISGSEIAIDEASVGQTPEVARIGRPDADRQAMAAQLEIDLRARLQAAYPNVRGTRVAWTLRDGSPVMQIIVQTGERAAASATAEPLRRLTLQTLRDLGLDAIPTDVEVQ